MNNTTIVLSTEEATTSENPKNIANLIPPADKKWQQG